MKASQRLIDYIKRAEGCRLTAYTDAAGVLTIGYGHTAGVRAGDRISEAEAERLLIQDLAQAEAEAARTPGVRTQGQLDAVADFVYNVGAGNFRTSTLRAYITGGRPTHEVQQQFLRWTKAGGRELGGLVSRRIWEAARWADTD